MKAKNLLLKLLWMLPLFLFIGFTLLTVNYGRHSRAVTAAGTAPEDTLPTADENCDVHFSVPSGFYEEDFPLTLSAPDGFTIYYTLDGSLPTTASAVYSSPLTVTNVSGQEKKYSNRADLSKSGQPVSSEFPEKAYIIRAVGINADGISTDVATATYFVGYEGYYENTSVLSIVSDPKNLFDEQSGIYVLGQSYYDHVAAGGDPSDDRFANYNQTGREWERPAHIDYFNADKEYVFSQETGIRINGNSSRSDSRKSLRLYARKEYDGNSRFLFPFFEEERYPKSLILRRGIFRNQFLPSLVYDRNIGTQKYSTCVVFIDGEFWGDYYILERYDEAYIENNYFVDDENVTIIKDGMLFEGSSVVYDAYGQLLSYMQNNDLSVPENYDYICSQFDMQSYIDYYCTQIFLNNYDFSESKNNVLWRSNSIDESNPYADGRWRWALLDLDFTLNWNDYENYATNSFSDARAVAQHTEQIMFGSLLANADFRQQFVTTFLDLENVNFDYDTVCKKMESVSSLINAETEADWKEYFEKRPAYINEYLAETFSLSGVLTDVTLEISDASAGEILLNTVTPDLTTGSWTGSYYSDYPVTVTALPKDGFRFKNWIVDGVEYSDTELTVPLAESGTQIYAVFEPEP